MTIKAIDTQYRGYLFRSRLEARWAVFFDTCGVKWEYEPEGFELPNGEMYLPDFKVYGCTERAPSVMWIEVKGQMTNKDASKIAGFIGDEAGRYTHTYYPNALLIVSNIPDGETFDEIMDAQSDCGSGWVRRDDWQGDYMPFNFQTIDGDFFTCHLCANGHGGLSFIGADSNYFSDAEMAGNLDEELTVYAFKKARQARFEHMKTERKESWRAKNI